MIITHYTKNTGFAMRIAVVSDFHSRRGDMKTGGILSLLAAEKPDLILAPGDFFNNTHEFSVREEYNINGLELLSGMTGLAPVYFSVGNHEHGLTSENRRILEDCGVHVLDNEIAVLDNLALCGLSSGYLREKKAYKREPVPDLSIIESFENTPGCRILLCHHPDRGMPMADSGGSDHAEPTPPVRVCCRSMLAGCIPWNTAPSASAGA